MGYLSDANPERALFSYFHAQGLALKTLTRTMFTCGVESDASRHAGARSRETELCIFEPDSGRTGSVWLKYAKEFIITSKQCALARQWRPVSREFSRLNLRGVPPLKSCDEFRKSIRRPRAPPTTIDSGVSRSRES